MIALGTMNAALVHYDDGGAVTDADESAFLGEVTAQAPRHLFVISHGWNNDEAEALDLYQRFFSAADQVWGAVTEWDATQAECFALGVIWPSKKFDENAFAAASGSAPGAAAGIGADTVDQQIAAQVRVLKQVADDPAAAALLDHVIAVIPQLSVSRSAQDDFVAALAAAFPHPPQEPDPGLDTGLNALNTSAGHDVLAQIVANLHAGPAAAAVAAHAGGAAAIGGAAGFNPLGAIKNAALVLANVTTYWTMKERAGVTGRTGVAQTLAKAMVAVPDATVHLIGHSFGGRLVTAAANALTGGIAGHQVATMMLLQAAYSHYGLAHDYQPNTDGMFRSVLTGAKVAREIQITHSIHDLAVGLAYPIASALARQIGAAVFVNPYGGMGADGARATPEAFEDTLGPAGTAYAPVQAPAIVRNLNGDASISSHGDVARPETAYATLVAASRA